MLSEEMEKDEKLMSVLMMTAAVMVHRDIERRAGVTLTKLQPFANKLHFMFSIYNNYNVRSRYKEIERTTTVEKVIEAVEEAMSVGNRQPRLLWYYDWQYLKVVRVPCYGFSI